MGPVECCALAWLIAARFGVDIFVTSGLVYQRGEWRVLGWEWEVVEKGGVGSGVMTGMVGGLLPAGFRGAGVLAILRHRRFDDQVRGRAERSETRTAGPDLDTSGREENPFGR